MTMGETLLSLQARGNLHVQEQSATLVTSSILSWATPRFAQSSHALPLAACLALL